MLPEIAAEALHFLTRRDLDRACVVNKQFAGLIDLYCDVYPLRQLSRIELLPSISNFKLFVLIEENRGDGTEHAFGSMDKAVHFIGSILCHSYVECLQLRDPGFGRSVTLFPRHWTILVDAASSGYVRSLVFNCVDFSALQDDAFMVAISCRGLRSLEAQWSVVPGGYVNDEMLRAGVAKGLLELQLGYKNKSHAPHRISDDVILDFFFRADAPLEGQSLSLCLNKPGITDMFVSKFFESLLSNPLRPSGSLEFYGAAKQRGLSAYAQYMAPRRISLHDTYRFPPVCDDSNSCEVLLDEDWTRKLYMRFYILNRIPGTDIARL